MSLFAPPSTWSCSVRLSHHRLCSGVSVWVLWSILALCVTAFQPRGKLAFSVPFSAGHGLGQNVLGGPPICGPVESHPRLARVSAGPGRHISLMAGLGDRRKASLSQCCGGGWPPPGPATGSSQVHHNGLACHSNSEDCRGLLSFSP